MALLDKLKKEIGTTNLGKYFDNGGSVDDTLLSEYITKSLAELSLMRPCKKITATEAVSGIEKKAFPTGAKKILRIYLDNKALPKIKTKYPYGFPENKGDWLADLALQEIIFSNKQTGDLRIYYAGSFAESDVDGTEWEDPVMMFARALCLEHMASLIRKDKTLKLDGVPEVTDKARAHEDLAKVMRKQFKERVNGPYGATS